MIGPMDRLITEPECENDIWVPLDDGRLCLIAGPLFRKLMDIRGEYETAVRLDLPILESLTTPSPDTPPHPYIHKETFEPIKYLEAESQIWKTGFIKV